MGMHKIILTLAVVLGAISAHAQTTVFDNDRNGNLSFLRTTYPDGSTNSAYYDYDRNGNLESIRRTSTPATPVAPAPTPRPFIAPYVNTDYNHDGQAIKKAVARTFEPQQAIIVVSQSEAEMKAASLAGAARVKAQAAAEAAQRKTEKPFKNGE